MDIEQNLSDLGFEHQILSSQSGVLSLYQGVIWNEKIVFACCEHLVINHSRIQGEKVIFRRKLFLAYCGDRRTILSVKHDYDRINKSKNYSNSFKNMLNRSKKPII